MKANNEKKITSREENYSQWYLDVIEAADLADNSPVHGCMIMKPYGYAIWEKMQLVLDKKFKAHGVENAYFPLLIPQSFLAKEAAHVEGFAKEVAVVTHHRLESDGNGGLKPGGELSEPLVIRPTSETIIYDAFSRWIQSYRDLPMLINQWANVVRWEMRTRPFLRTTEFLWQEGHTAHATKEGADAMTMAIVKEYQDFSETHMALPVIPGRKTEGEKFAGADYTTCIEAMMQDGKALQAGTSHMLGQNFAKAFEVKFLNDKEVSQYVWQTSWGVSTRLIGALIMAHSDDKGLVLPPNLAPISVVIIPIGSGTAEFEKVSEFTAKLATSLEKEIGVTVKVDSRDQRPGEKFFHWEKKGVPVRVEVGPKDLAAGTVVLVRRDSGEKFSVPVDEVPAKIKELLGDIQKNLYEKAAQFREDHTKSIDSWSDFEQAMAASVSMFVLAHWCGSAECEAKIKETTGATIRCIPFDQKKEAGKCILCGNESDGRVVFAKAY